jgi:hypothetical protein
MPDNMPRLLAPQYMAYWELKAFFRCDSSVAVSTMTDDEGAAYAVLTATTPAKAQALANVISLNYIIDSTVIRVFDNSGTEYFPQDIPADDTAAWLAQANAAFAGNSRIRQILLVQGALGVSNYIFIVAEKQVIQVWIDDLFDLYGNENPSVSELLNDKLLRKVMPDGIGLRATTVLCRDVPQI